MSLQYVFIIHRQMGCNDEASTDVEQAEKILYFYPYDMSMYGQLTKINMLEGLIEFSGKFSSDPLDVVVMEKHTWGFYECEKDIWIIAAVDNNDENSEFPNLSSHRPNAYGLQLAIKRLYHMYYSFYGTLAASLHGDNGSGWKAVQAIQLIRKQIRKLNIKLRQQTQDLDTMNELMHPEVIAVDNPERSSEVAETKPARGRTISDLNSLQLRESVASEHMGIQSHMTTIEQLNTEIAATNAEIAEKTQQLDGLYYDDTYYIARRVRDSLCRFMKFYLSSSGTGLSTASGSAVSSAFDVLRGASLQSFGSVPNCNSSLIRLRLILESSIGSHCIGTLMLYDGQVVWSDLDNSLTQTVTEFIQMQDLLALRNRASSLLELCLGDKARNNGNKFQVTDSEIESFIGQKLNETVDGKRGFVSYGWECVDLNEDAVINQLIQWGSTSASTSVASSDGAGASSEAQDRTLLRPMSDKDVVSDFSLDASKLFCPRIYSQNVCVGRVLIYRQQRFMMALVLPEWGSDVASKFSFADAAVKAFLSSPQQPNASTAAEKKHQITVKQFLKHILGSGADEASVTTTTNGATAVLSNRHITPEAMESGCVLAFCAVVQQAVTAEVAKLDKAIRKADPPKGNAAAAAAVASTLRNVNSLKNSMALNSSASAGARIFINNNGVSAAAAAGGGGGAGGVSGAGSADNSGTSSPLPSHVFSNSLTTAAAAARNIRLVYYNAMSHTVKMNNVYDNSISPVTQLSPEMRDLVLTQLKTKDAFKRKVIYAVSDKLAAETDSHFPHSCELLTSSLEPPVMRALNDIWAEIAAKEMSSQSPHHRVVEACLRVSTAQRGGIWVTGRKMGDSRYLFLVIDKCATLNEMHEIFEDICDGLQGRSLVL